MATKKLTPKQIEKVREIIDNGISIDTLANAARTARNEPSDAKVLKASLKEIEKQAKVLSRAIKVLCPPPKEE